MIRYLLIALALLLFAHSFLCQEFTLKEKCSKCRTIVQQFKDGLLRTAKSNFGGGNTDWEETRLKGFAASETRLIEIMESMCSGDKFCSLFLEAQEEVIENWWFGNAELLRTDGQADEGASHIASKFANFLCVRETAVCCQNKTYGPNCTPCPSKVSETPCSGHGSCDGDGTRSGTGKCQCSQGYTGDECSECDAGFFSLAKDESEETYDCSACERNCDLCDGAGPGQCLECFAGFELAKKDSDEETGHCVDIDECASSESPCKVPSTYCANVPGSYKCMSCDSACDSSGCIGAGPGACAGGCAPGYKKQFTETSETVRCEDIDECADADITGAKLCEGKADDPASPVCHNTPGSYRCGCLEGHKLEDGTCTAVMEHDEPQEVEHEKEKYVEKKVKKGNSKKLKSNVNKPATNKSPASPKAPVALETDFNLIYFCAMLFSSIVVVTALASKPMPWPAVGAVLLAFTAIYVYYYVGTHEPRKAAEGSDSTAHKSSRGH